MNGLHWWQTRWFALFVMLVAAVPLLWPAVPPLTDLPGHIGRYRVMLGDGAGLDRYYSFQWRMVGNLGVDLLVAALAPWIGLEPAVKLIVVGVPAITAGAILWLSREICGRVSPFALFALPLAYSYPFHFGFVNFCLAVALSLSAWALWLRLGRLGHVRARAILFLGIGGFVWTAHLMGWAMLCLFLFASEWARARSDMAGPVGAARAAVIACLPLAPPLLMLLLWRNSGDAGAVEGFFNLPVKLRGLATVLRDRWSWLDVPSVVLICVLIYAGVRRRIGHLHPVAAAAAGLTSLAFLLLPFGLMGSAYADLRLLPYAMIAALVGIVPRADWPSRRIALAGLIFFLLRIAATTASFAIYDREWSRELAALDQLPRGARVLALVGDTCGQRWALTRQTHLPSLAIARRAAFTNDQWRMEGAPLLAVRMQGAGYFAYDPSQISVPAACAHNPYLVPQVRALAIFPRSVFTHVWLIRPHPGAAHRLKGLAPVWSNGDSVLYAVERPSSRLPRGAAPQ